MLAERDTVTLITYDYLSWTGLLRLVKVIGFEPTTKLIYWMSLYFTVINLENLFLIGEAH